MNDAEKHWDIYRCDHFVIKTIICETTSVVFCKSRSLLIFQKTAVMLIYLFKKLHIRQQNKSKAYLFSISSHTLKDVYQSKNKHIFMFLRVLLLHHLVSLFFAIQRTRLAKNNNDQQNPILFIGRDSFTISVIPGNFE